MSTSQHTCQIARDTLGRYISIGMEEPGTPHQFPPQPTNPPTVPTPIETNTLVHILDSPVLSPSPFQYLPQEVSTMEIHLTEEQSHSTPVSAPVSRTSPTDSGEILQQLVQALTLLGHAPPASTPPAPPSTPATHIRSPDAFDRSNPDDLRPFLLQCQLTFNSYPQHYASDSSKVFFAISYLKKSTLEWFKIGVMEIDPRLAPSWRSNWPDFITEIRTHFGPLNPTRTLEIKLRHLSMQPDSRISEYLVRFNTLASRVSWGDAALCFQFYDGLPKRLKDKIAILGKPKSLREMVNVTVRYDALHWERQAEQSMNHQFDPKTIPPCPSEPPRAPTTNLLPTNCNSATTPHQPETSRTTPHTPKPYDNVLGLDGKLKPEELERRHKNRLCLACGSGNHQANECPTSKRGQATELQVPETPRKA